jgi:hypothetical protein
MVLNSVSWSYDSSFNPVPVSVARSHCWVPRHANEKQTSSYVTTHGLHERLRRFDEAAGYKRLQTPPQRVRSFATSTAPQARKLL